jgi:hypothetical protein
VLINNRSPLTPNDDPIALRIASIPAQLAHDGRWEASNEVLDWIERTRILPALLAAQIQADTIGRSTIRFHTDRELWLSAKEAEGASKIGLLVINRDRTMRGSPVTRAEHSLRLYRQLVQSIVLRATRGGTIVCYEEGLSRLLQESDDPESYILEASNALREGLDKTGILYADAAKKIEVITDSSTSFLAESYDRLRTALLADTDLTELKLFNTTTRSKGLAGIDEEESLMLQSLALKVSGLWKSAIGVGYAIAESYDGSDSILIDPLDYALELELPDLNYILPDYLLSA